MSDNPYVPPESDLSRAPSELSGGSLSLALQGRYEIWTRKIWSHAWRSTSGAKLPILGGMALFVGAAWGLTYLLALVGLDGQARLNRGELLSGYLLSIASGFLVSPVTVPLMAGVWMMGARRAAGLPISLSDAFGYFDRVVPLFIVNFLYTMAIYVGFLFCVLPGIYLSVAFSFAVPLVADKGLGPLEALETSRKAVHSSWFPVFGFALATLLAFALALIPIVTFVWIVPWLYLALGTLYWTIFGVEGAPGVAGSAAVATAPGGRRRNPFAR